MDYKKEKIKIYIFTIILFLSYSGLFSETTDSWFGTFKDDFLKIITTSRLGFSIAYNYYIKRTEFPYKDEINYSYLNQEGLEGYYNVFQEYDSISYNISLIPSSRLSLKWSAEKFSPYRVYDSQNGVFKLLQKENSQLDIEYFVIPRWSLYGILVNQQENSSFDTAKTPFTTVLQYDSTLPKISSLFTNSVTIGSKISPYWGSFNIYAVLTEVYNKPLISAGAPQDAIVRHFYDTTDIIITKENTLGLEYYINPSVKIDMQGIVQTKYTKNYKSNGLFGDNYYYLYPFEIKYRLTEIWELGVKIHNETNKSSSEYKKQVGDSVEEWKIVKDDYEKKYYYTSLSLSRYFKYQGLNIYGKFYKIGEETLYSYQELIPYSDEKNTLWTRWDESVYGYDVETGFYYRPVMEKLYISAAVKYSFPRTYRKSLPAYETRSTYDYSFSAFYKPAPLFEIKIEKKFSDVSSQLDEPKNSNLKQIDIWRIEKNSFHNVTETEKVEAALRTPLYTVSYSILQGLVSLMYTERDNIISSERFYQPWAFLDVYTKYIEHSISFSIIPSQQPQLTLGGGLTFKPDYSYDDGAGNIKTKREYGYLFNIRFEFNPNFYIEGMFSEGEYYEKTINVGRSIIGDVTAKDDFWYTERRFRLNLVYRP